MTFQEKLDNSIIISERTYPKDKRHVKTKKQRLIGLLISLLIISYNIITKFIIKESLFDFQAIVCIFSFIFSFSMAVFDKSTYMYNYNKAFLMLRFMARLCSLILAIFSLLNTLTLLEDSNFDIMAFSSGDISLIIANLKPLIAIGISCIVLLPLICFFIFKVFFKNIRFLIPIAYIYTSCLHSLRITEDLLRY